MAALTGIHESDYGFALRLTCKEDGAAADISSFTTRQYIFRKPSGATVTKTATFNGSGTDGVLTYTMEEGVLDVAGLWQVCARLSKTGQVVTSEAALMPIEARLD